MSKNLNKCLVVAQVIYSTIMNIFGVIFLLALVRIGSCQTEQLTLEECFDKYERGIYPHPSDCTKFLSCATTDPLECPAGLHFNPTEFVCDWPASAGCMKITTPNPEEASPTTPSPDSSKPPESPKEGPDDKTQAPKSETDKPTDDKVTSKPSEPPSESENSNEPQETTPAASTASQETTTKASTPSESEKPSEPQETTPKSSTPSESEKPSEPQETTPKSSTPSESEKPSEPQETTPKASTPSESEKPSEPEETTPKSSTPSESEKPSEPQETTPKSSTPSESEKPSEPQETTPKSSTPSESEKPSEPQETTPKSSTPSESEKPSEPQETTPKASTLSESEKPSEPQETTPKSSTPSESEKPSEPQETTPKVSTPSESEKPSEPQESTPKPSTLSESEKPSEPQETTPKVSTPSESEKPSEPQETTPKLSTPSESEKPTEPQESTPKASTPSESDKPSEPQTTTSKASTPSESEKPSEPQEATSKASTPSESEKPVSSMETQATPSQVSPAVPSESVTPGPITPAPSETPKVPLEAIDLESRFKETTPVPESDKEPMTELPQAPAPDDLGLKECVRKYKFGIFPHPSDSNKFYICTKAKPREMTCPQGLEFDMESFGCNRPKATPAPPPPALSLRDCLVQYKRGLFPHPTDCTKFYACSKRGPIELTCTGGLHFNPMKFVCDWPSRHCVSPESKTRDMILRTMKSDKIYPDVVDQCPEKLAEVAFPSGGQVNLGKELTPSQALEPPTIYWKADKNSFYTLCMVDADAPKPKESKFNQWNHWTVGNIPGNNIRQGNTLAEYLPPCPQQNTGAHRYTYMIYKQPNRINFQQPKIPANTWQNRDGFSLRNFAQKYQLGQPIAGNYFKCRFDRSVPQTFQRIGYQPPQFNFGNQGNSVRSSYSYSYSFRI